MTTDVAVVSELQPDRGRRPDRETAVIEYLRSHGASFFGPLHEAVGGGYPAETVGALWNLVWQGVVTNDTFHALRAFTRVSATSKRPRRAGPPVLRSRRLTLPSAEGRWSLVHPERANHTRPHDGRSRRRDGRPRPHNNSSRDTVC